MGCTLNGIHWPSCGIALRSLCSGQSSSRASVPNSGSGSVLSHPVAVRHTSLAHLYKHTHGAKAEASWHGNTLWTQTLDNVGSFKLKTFNWAFRSCAPQLRVWILRHERLTLQLQILSKWRPHEVHYKMRLLLHGLRIVLCVSLALVCGNCRPLCLTHNKDSHLHQRHNHRSNIIYYTTLPTVYVLSHRSLLCRAYRSVTSQYKSLDEGWGKDARPVWFCEGLNACLEAACFSYVKGLSSQADNSETEGLAALSLFPLSRKRLQKWSNCCHKLREYLMSVVVYIFSNSTIQTHSKAKRRRGSTRILGCTVILED